MAKKLLFLSNIKRINSAREYLNTSHTMSGTINILGETNEAKRKEAVELINKALCILNQIEA